MVWQKLPVGSRFLTLLSVYRENVSNHWETDLIMFAFLFLFFNFHSLHGFSSVSSFKPQLCISLHTHTFFFWFPVGPSRARPPRLSVTFRVIQKSCCLFLCWTKISCCQTQSLVGKYRRCFITFISALRFESVRVRKEHENINSEF